jgi:hypothetical protein
MYLTILLVFIKLHYATLSVGRVSGACHSTLHKDFLAAQVSMERDSTNDETHWFVFRFHPQCFAHLQEKFISGFSNTECAPGREDAF